MRLLVIRASAMGDVALVVPVLRAFIRQYPSVEITFVTRSSFTPFFNTLNNIHFFCPDFKKRHKGFRGVIRLFTDLRKNGGYDHIIDLHDVIRSRLLRLMFRFTGIRISVIDKGRRDKRKIIRGRLSKPLKHSVERYFDVFSDAGFPVKNEPGPWITPSEESIRKVNGILSAGEFLEIGVAPFAKHELKVWPEEYMIRLLTRIRENQKVRFWLFGGKEETAALEKFHNKVADSFMIPADFRLNEELALISRLSLMISMDSSNMHMAALSGTKVISIWGGTDPVTGFSAWQQPDDYAVRIPKQDLSCRPCTVFGKGLCRRGDFACMIRLTPEKVFERLVDLKIL